jgi:hypothetical protein
MNSNSKPRSSILVAAIALACSTVSLGGAVGYSLQPPPPAVPIDA